MKKKLLGILVLLLLTVIISSCSYPEYEVRFVLNNGMDDVVETVSSGSQLFTPDSPDEALVFGGWYKDATLSEPLLSANIKSDMTLYAKWVKRGMYTATFIYDNGAGNSVISFEGTVTQPKDPERIGHIFTGWENASDGKPFDFGKEYSGDVILRASWKSVTDKLTVTLHYNNGKSDFSVEVDYGNKLIQPEAPVKAGHTFIGWYMDSSLKTPYDFSVAVKSDTHLYARYAEDLEGVVNLMATEGVKATVKIKNYRYNASIFGSVTDASTLTGSGVIYKLESGVYYCLTNNHVIVESSDYKNTQLSVFDCYGNEYSATLVKSDATYDLAVLAFTKGSQELPIATLKDKNAEVGEGCISVGNPGGLINSITYGDLLRYQAVNMNDCFIEFAVGFHNAPIDHGSSGGAVFDYEMNVIGINFATASETDGSFQYGLFVPIEKVREFLNQ